MKQKNFRVSVWRNLSILTCCSFALYYLLCWNDWSPLARGALKPFLDTTSALRNAGPPILSEKLPIFWINLDSAPERGQATQERLDSLLRKGFDLTHERVGATDEEEIFRLLSTHSLVLNGIKLDFQWNSVPTWMMHVWGSSYLYSEAACLVSHLKAILLAYQKGLDYALFMEDDVVLQVYFLEEWRHQVSLAPKDWRCLQWVTNNKAIRERGMKMLDSWISWQPDHWSTGAYMLNRKGMQAVLSQALSIRSDRGKVWQVMAPQVLVADEVIFLLARETYTSTYPWWFDYSPVHSSIGRISSDRDIVRETTSSSHFLPPHINKEALQSRESILVLLNFRVSSSTAIVQEVERLIADASTMAAYHTHCIWRVKAVVTDETLRLILMSELQRLPGFIEVVIEVSDERFNKFSFFSKSIPDMAHFDRVLLKDNDIRIAGFPWMTFLESIKDAIIAAPIRQAVDESLLRNCIGQEIRPQRQWYRFHQGLNWKLEWGDKDIFRDYTPIQVPFLEQYFVLMDGSFARWFLKQVLTPDFTEQLSSWGPDKMWCSAAKEYDPSRPSCVISSLIIRDDDTRQIYKNSLHRRLGDLSLDRFRQVDSFNRWMATSYIWDAIVGGQKLKGIERSCNFLTKLSTFDLQACARLVSLGRVSSSLGHLPVQQN